ncbi:hypothetical protein STEG23_016531 [Scotinomys teguina]
MEYESIRIPREEIGLPFSNRGKKDYVWNPGDPVGRLLVLLRPVIKVNGKLQQANPGNMAKGTDPTGMKNIFVQIFVSSFNFLIMCCNINEENINVIIWEFPGCINFRLLKLASGCNTTAGLFSLLKPCRALKEEIPEKQGIWKKHGNMTPKDPCGFSMTEPNHTEISNMSDEDCHHEMNNCAPGYAPATAPCLSTESQTIVTRNLGLEPEPLKPGSEWQRSSCVKAKREEEAARGHYRKPRAQYVLQWRSQDVGDVRVIGCLPRTAAYGELNELKREMDVVSRKARRTEPYVSLAPDMKL